MAGDGEGVPDVRLVPYTRRMPEASAVGGMSALRRGRTDGDAWSGLSLRERLSWVRRFRGLVSSHADEFVRLVSEEVHKPEHETLTSDVMALLAACRWHERHAARVLRSRRVGGRPLWMAGMRHRVHRFPLGRVAIIATWNYPIQLLGVQLVQALVAGNRVVVKPSEHAPRTQDLLLRLAVAAGLPEGALEWSDSSREAGARMIQECDPDHVVFTGSTRIGRAIGAVLGERLIPSTLELSGCDSAFVLDDADVELAARTIWHTVTMNGGQTCMAPRRALVDQKVYAEFVRALAPLAAGAVPRRLITRESAERVHALAVDAIERGGRSLSGVCESARDGWIRPLAISDCPEDAALVGGDHFGPVLAVVPVDSVEHGLRIHRACGQHLTANVYTRSQRRAAGLAPLLGASIVMVNDGVIPSGHPGVALGGHGLSGWGVSRGGEGLLAMTRGVTVSGTSRRVRIPTDAPDAGRLRLLRRAMWWLYPGKAGEVIAPSEEGDLTKTDGAGAERGHTVRGGYAGERRVAEESRS